MADKQGSDSFDRPIFPGTGGAQGSVIVRNRRRKVSLQGKMFLFTLIALATIAASVIMFLGPKESHYTLDNYQVAQAGTADFRSLIFTAGRVIPDQVVVFTAPNFSSQATQAQVRQVYVKPGDDVVPGQVLIEIASENLIEQLHQADGARAEAAIEQEQARLQAEQENAVKQRELDQAVAAMQEAEAHLAFMQVIYDRGGVSHRELEQAEADVEHKKVQIEIARHSLEITRQRGELSIRKAENTVKTADKQLASLQEQVTGLTVRSNYAGRVLSLAVRQGSIVTQGVELLSVADLREQSVETAVTPEQAFQVRPGLPALIRFGSYAVPAAVRFVSPQATTTNDGSAVPVSLALDPEVAAALVPNTDVSVEIELGLREGRTALLRGPFFASGDTSFVYVVSEDGRRAQRRDVRFGAIDGSIVEVLEGLELGERIVYSSYSAFRSYPTIELLPEGGRYVEWP